MVFPRQENNQGSAPCCRGPAAPSFRKPGAGDLANSPLCGSDSEAAVSAPAFRLRIEATANDVSFSKDHRKVEHRDGHATRELAAVKKSIYSLIDLRAVGLIWKFGGTYRNCLTRPGGNAIAAACRLSEQIIVPAPAVRQGLIRIGTE